MGIGSFVLEVRETEIDKKLALLHCDGPALPRRAKRQFRRFLSNGLKLELTRIRNVPALPEMSESLPVIMEAELAEDIDPLDALTIAEYFLRKVTMMLRSKRKHANGRRRERGQDFPYRRRHPGRWQAVPHMG